MTDSAALDVALGLIFAYLVFSLAASRINEVVASKLQWRAKGLERGLRAMVGDPAAPEDTPGAQADGSPTALVVQSVPVGTALSAKAVKEHPTIAALDAGLKKNRRISYLSARTFGATVLDLLSPPAGVLADDIDQSTLTQPAKQALEKFRARPEQQQLDAFRDVDKNDATITQIVERLRPAVGADRLEQVRASVNLLAATHPARRTLLRMIDEAEGSRDKFRSQLEHWFDDEMDRVSGWYQRQVQKFILSYGVVLVLLFNVDTIGIAQTLWRSPVDRAATAAVAVSATQKTVGDIDTSPSALRALSLPIGWTAPHATTGTGAGKKSAVSKDPRHIPADFGQVLLKLIGLAITVLALSFGAPFWFDALGKLARVRNAGNTPPVSDAGGAK